MSSFEEKLLKMISRAGLTPRPSYNATEAGEIFGVSDKTIERMLKEFEVIDGEPKPGTLQGFLTRSTMRVAHDEMVSFLERGAKAIETAG